LIGLALLALAPTVRVIEYVDKASTEVSIQVIARVPELSQRQADALDELVDDIPRDIEGLSRRDVNATTNGAPVRCAAGPDYIRISFSVPPDNWRSGLSLMEALVQHSRLAPKEGGRHANPSAWLAALRPFVRNAPKPSEVQDLYRALFRPENMTVAIGGPIVSGQAQEDWQRRVDQWPRTKAQIATLGQTPQRPLERNPGGLDSIELYGPTFGSADAALSTRTLALIALGSGKGSSLFRIGRQKLGLSYRQEALLYPVSEGWQPRLLQVMRPTGDLAGKAETLRKALLDDVDHWTDTNLRRALGMADAIFTRGVNFSPFSFGPSGSIDASLESRTFQNAYWQLKTNTTWDASAFLRLMRDVKLDDLRSTAKAILTQAQVRTLPG
jgi:hypothetical protein